MDCVQKLCCLGEQFCKGWVSSYSDKKCLSNGMSMVLLLLVEGKEKMTLETIIAVIDTVENFADVPASR